MSPNGVPDFVCTRSRGCFRGSDLPLFDPPAMGEEPAPQCTTVHHDAPQSGASQGRVHADDPCAGRHGGNPQSEAAFRGLCCSGRRKTYKQWVLEQIRIAGPRGLTGDELSKLASVVFRRDIYPNSLSGRITDLKRTGLIRGTGQTRPTRTGAQAEVLVAAG